MSTQEHKQFRRKLLATFDAESVEDGYTHAGEVVLEEALMRHGADAERWIDLLFEAEGPSTVAAMLQCLGRLTLSGAQGWRVALLGRALAHPAAVIRDAAAQAAELWGDSQVI